MTDLELENKRLRDRVQELEALAGMNLLESLTCQRVVLTRKQAQVLGLLMTKANKILSRGAIFDYLFGHLPDCDQPSMPSVDQVLHQLRRVLKLHGLVIRNEPGSGWYLNDQDIEEIRTVMTGTLWIKNARASSRSSAHDHNGAGVHHPR